ncbi:Probable LRR receptor-like serine/threonine-protein kinase At3g47570 [Linum perenne]
MASSFLYISSFALPLLLLLLLSCFSLIPLPVVSGTGSNETDRLALLQVKSTLIDPLGALNSWNQTLHFCQWQGVFCNEQRVTQLDLKLNRLSGTISPYIGNLTFLTHLILNNNTISGEIPPDIGRLHSLQELVLVQNSLTGTIPANISACSNLTSLRIGYNGLMGEIPLELCKLMKLQLLSIHFNNLTGNFPSCFGNVSSLEAISAPRNGFVGGIPESLARLRNLKIMSFGSNRFSGVFPPQFFNSSSIQVISVIQNQLTGTLPPELGLTLPNLVHLNLAVNNFSGQIPDSISNATNLQVLELGQNNFHGKVPSLAKLNRLQLLGLINNSLGSDGQDGDDLMFLHSLTNSTLLEVVNVGMNNFAGNLPHSISNYSTTFVRLSLRISRVFGTLPPGLDRLVNLEQLDFNDNRLSGHLPIELGKIPKLMTLQVQNNNLSGTIPSNIGNSTKLLSVWLQGNHLEGSIPSSFGSCKGMTLLYLASNNLSGSIPPEILNLPDLSITLNLSRNSLSGQIPDEVGNLINLGRLDLSNNFLTGRIPANLGRCVRLETLNLMGNMFQGSIPSSLRALRGLVVLDLSRNNLSGEVPVFLQEFTSLVRLNLSYNNLEGALLKQGIFGNATVTMVMGNSELCGGMPEFGLPKCPVQGSKKGGLNTVVKIVISVVCGLLGLISLLSFIYLCFLKKKIKDPEASKFTGNALLEATYHHLLKATDGFSSANLLGVGSFGSVYQGLIVIDDSSTKMVAVKVLNLQNARASKSFVAECEVLKNIRHRNLVKLLTVCSGIDYHGNEFKALVYDFMVNGSLEEWLHIQVIPEEASTRKLTLLQRLNIAIDVGSGLDYLHNNSGIPVVHCDLKPSNILLDVNMVGHIGDFGLAKFLPEVAAGPPTTDIANSSIGVRGTVGYSAPEYGMGSEVSRSGDVYSYGILLLEMFTGRRPTDEMFRDGLNLHNFIAEGLPDKAAEIMDPVLLMEMQENSRFITSNQGWRPDQQVLAEALVSIVQVGVDCSNETPRERMSISDASASLTAVRDKFISGRTNERHTAIEGAASPASS